MEIRFDKTGEERKALAAEVSEITGFEAKYMSVPSFAYRIGGYTITKDGTLETDNREGVSLLLAALEVRGFIPVEMQELPGRDVEEDRLAKTSGEGYSQDMLVMELADDGVTDQVFDNMVKLVAGKAALIRKAAGKYLAGSAEALPITRKEGRIYFPWFRFDMKSEAAAAWLRFVSALCATAKKQKRVILKEKPLEEGSSEKFAMRCFLLKLGFIGDEYKTARKVILEGLSGDGSHKKPKEADIAPTEEDELAEALADAELIHSVNAYFQQDH